MHTSSIHIRSSRLEVEIAQPGTQYRGTVLIERFHYPGKADGSTLSACLSHLAG
jgi:hypothetical protein